ncbi:response regulator [Plebeiibacterium marinum]|uniref:Response regulator n=1 Tax=Plebeiibacterium marinum TaxID=2992111 RepID=A0AAE3MB23_9BACT|nr:response regulator [Plebeiobacterium marinum]MCW3804603.1 response regulator [Plebeiobacterium marinum]
MKKVLIVDDALDARVTIKQMLSGYDFNIIEAHDGLDGWNKIIKEKPDLILLDLYMPNKDGFEILRDIQEEWLEIPVVILSGDTSINTIQSCLNSGASAYIQKPIIKQDFNDTIKTLCA